MRALAGGQADARTLAGGRPGRQADARALAGGQAGMRTRAPALVDGQAGQARAEWWTGRPGRLALNGGRAGRAGSR